MKRLALLLPFVVGAKCVGYDPTLVEVDPQSDEGGASVPCSARGEAHLRVEEFAFAIECGCAEAPWEDGAQGARTCTVPPGTKVIWHFSGSVEHNVRPLAEAFADSGTKTRGQYAVTFAAPGVYDYGCSLHPVEMSGYRVQVVSEAD